MGRSVFAVVTSLLLQCMIVISGAAQNELDSIVARYRQYLFRIQQHDTGSITEWAASFQQNAQWPDINYQDAERANWQLLKHLHRVRELGFAWADPQSPFYHQDEVRKVWSGALDHWLEKRFKNANWWHNDIGVPQYMRDIIVLLQDAMTAGQRRQCLEVLGQHRVLGKGQGANLIWSADLGLHYGALTNNTALVEKCRTLMVDELAISGGEGIQADYSFHQHGKRLQVFQYGKAFVLDNVRVAWELRGTSWEYPQEKVTLLTDFIFNTWQWMARGIHTVPGTMDRSSSRENELRSPDIRRWIPFLIELCPERAADFRTFADWQNGSGQLNGMRHWPYSDFTAYHRASFSFFLKTISSRTLSTESINNENLKGHLLNNGDAYLVHDGNEYFNLMPVWNWDRVPGVTVFDGGRLAGHDDFMGNVNNGASGMTSMRFVLKDGRHLQQITARKIWAAHNDVVVCLIADLKATNMTGAVSTALDQCRWRGEVTVNEPGRVLKEGVHDLKKVKWIHHENFAYIPLSDEYVTVSLQEVSGTWRSVNLSQSAKPLTEKIFLPVLEHGPARGQSTGYALASCVTVEQAAELARKPRWKVLRNDRECQAVVFEDGTLMASFAQAGRLKYGKHSLMVNKPSLVLVGHEGIYLSNPLHTTDTIEVKWDKRSATVTFAGAGETKKAILADAP